MSNQFAMDTTSLSTESPLLDTGFYAGTIVGATIVGKENKQYFQVREQHEFVNNVRTATGKHELTGILRYAVSLTSKKAIRVLRNDTPRVYANNIYLSFTDKHVLDLEANVQLAQLIEATGLGEEDFGAAVDFEFDDDIEVPEKLAGVEDIVTMLNGLEYAKQVLTLICQTIEDREVMANVLRKQDDQNKEAMMNQLNMGSRSAPFCGVIPYEDGAEEDDKEAEEE